MPNDEEVFRILCKFVEEDKARDAIKKHIILEEEFLEIITQQWELLENELTIVPVLKRLFSDISLDDCRKWPGSFEEGTSNRYVIFS